MDKMSLQERLSHLEPKQKKKAPTPRLLGCMPMRTYINVVRFLIPERKDILARLIRLGKDSERMEKPLGEIVADAVANETNESLDLIYDIMVRPFEAIAKEAKYHG